MKKKVWFITGASEGFGLKIAKAALATGVKVVGTVRKDKEAFADSLNEKDRVLVVQLDVTKEHEVKAGVQYFIATFGTIDVLVNNAGYGLLAAMKEASDEEVKQQYEASVVGLLNVARSVLPNIRRRGSGHINNVSSLFGYSVSFPGFGIYGFTKFAVEGISEGLALEVKPWGIHVTSVAPGLFSTKFASNESYQTSWIILDSYNDTVGGARKFMKQLNGNQPGDPSKLARVLIELTNSNNPPLHLSIGKDAVSAFRTKMASMQKEVDEWDADSSSTDHHVMN